MLLFKSCKNAGAFPSRYSELIAQVEWLKKGDSSNFEVLKMFVLLNKFHSLLTLKIFPLPIISK